MSNKKLKGLDREAIRFKRFLGWTIKDLSLRYDVTTRTIYRVLKR